MISQSTLTMGFALTCLQLKGATDWYDFNSINCEATDFSHLPCLIETSCVTAAITKRGIREKYMKEPRL